MAAILLVDDDEIFIDLLWLRLENAGHSVSIALVGEAALKWVQNVRPALVIVDSMMSVLAGIEVLTALRANATTRAIPIIMITARKGEADVASALKAGNDDYLTKPFMPQELLTRVEILLSKSQENRNVQPSY